jgi:hypothetical protein
MTREKALQAHKELSAYAVDGVLPEQVSRMVREFIRCADWLEQALEHGEGTHDLGDVLSSLLSKDRQFWPGTKCGGVTEIIDFPKKRTLNIFLAGGEPGASEELKRMLPSIEAFARAAECSEVTLSGRKGWLRSFMAEAGYREVSVTMAKEMRDEQHQDDQNE